MYRININRKDKETERESRHKTILYWFLPWHRSDPVSLHFEAISL